MDSSFIIACLVPEEISIGAKRLRESWERAGEELIAPGLMQYEVISVLRNFVYRRIILPAEGEEAFGAFSDFLIDYLNPPNLAKTAWEIAKQVGAARAYDMFYVALAEESDCPLWTGDRRLSNLVKSHFQFVRCVSDVRGDS